MIIVFGPFFTILSRIFAGFIDHHMRRTTTVEAAAALSNLGLLKISRQEGQFLQYWLRAVWFGASCS